MSESMLNDEFVRAEESPSAKVSAVWLIPIVALLIGCWMLYDYFNQLGSEIKLHLKTAEGIEVGKTFIKSRNVNVGVIESIKLSDDYSAIIATARVSPDAERMLTRDARFWVVKPRIGKEGITGLDTLLSGAYIELEPGRTAVGHYEFNVLEHPPVASADEQGIRVVLNSRQAGKLGVGDPVLYEGFTVGRVESTGFDTDKRQAFYQLFINKPYDELVRSNSQFWLASGLNMQLSAKGLDLQVGSLESLLRGGVSFGLPEGRLAGEKVEDGEDHFRLYDSRELASQSLYSQYLEYVMLFDESVRGLHEGASVEFRGITIGKVVKAPLTLQQYGVHGAGLSNGTIPVLVRIELARVFENAESAGLEQLRSEIDRDLGAGLRASLKTGSLLTGALFIDLDLYPDAEPYQAGTFMEYPLFPTKRAGVAEIQKQVGQLISKLNNLPLESTFQGVNHTLENTSAALAQWDKVGQRLEQLLKQQEMQALPGELQNTLREFQGMAQDYGQDSAMYAELQSSLKQLKAVMRELQPLSRQLNEKPNLLIMGADTAADPTPKKAD
ncbi:intermembrane transport protein PqiB [Shewanella algae]|nr:intermembrane transport protein PqiB [Shewanella algae]QNV07523.1 intermembrane transport protein PqiB [Shewanella algae]